MNAEDRAHFSRYLRSQGYATRTVYRARIGASFTIAVKRQADHLQAYAYPIRNSDGQPGAAWVDSFTITVDGNGVSDGADARCGWIDGRDLRHDPENVVRNSGGLDYYGPAEAAIYA